MAECPLPPPCISTPRIQDSSSMPKDRSPRTSEHSRVATQPSMIDTTIRTNVGGPTGTAHVPETTGISDEEEEVQDPMVSDPI